MSSINAVMLPMSDGFDIPQVYCAAFRLASTEETTAHVHRLYQSGVRHFEIAELHGNGHTICEALGEICMREEVFITLKVWPKSRDPTDVLETVDFLLQSYNLTYVDLLMMHAPIDADNKIEQYKALEELKDKGMTKSIGIANLNAVLLQDLLKNCRIPPAVYETESHAFGQNDDIVEFCNDSSIVVMNNEPLCKGMRLQHKQLVELADSLNMSPARLMLLWTKTKSLCVGLPANNNQVITELAGFDVGVASYLAEDLSPKTMEEMCRFEEGLSCQWNPAEAVVDD